MAVGGAPADATGAPVRVAFTAAAGGMTADAQVDVLPFGSSPAGTTATASSYPAPNVVNGQVRTYNPRNAIDGNLATFWNDDTAGAYPDVLTITSPSPVTLSGIALASNSDGVPVDFVVDT